MTDLPFFDDAGDAVAVFAFGFLLERREDLLEALDVTLCLPQMRLERVSQRRGAGRLGQLRKRLGQLMFGVVDVVQLVDERVVKCSGFSHGGLL
jgi:hypothetical protein